MVQVGHCWCITTGDRSGKMAKNHLKFTAAQIEPPDKKEREREREREIEREREREIERER